MMKPARYHSALVALHWLLALMLIFSLAMGTFALKTVPNSSPDKIDALRGHMIAGGLILLLTLTRLVVRLKTEHPVPASTGNALLDRLAPAVHWALYLLVLVMAGSGVAMSVLAGLPQIVFGGAGSLPVNFDALPPRAVHGIVAKLLMLGIALHVAAALYHQFVRRDGLLARMGFGPRWDPKEPMR
jgi:cytochrome b561